MADPAPQVVPQAPQPPLVGVEALLAMIGFNNLDERQRIMQEGLQDYFDFRHLTETHINKMSEAFAKRTVNNGRINFGIRRTENLIGVMYWIQDKYRAVDIPDHNDFTLAGLDEAVLNAKIRKTDLDLVDMNSKAADPGKFKEERKWPEWHKAFVHYLSVIPGINGVPLSYVVREEEEPEYGAVYPTYQQRCIARAPLADAVYIADTRRVHNILRNFVQGEASESWIRTIARYQDGRRDLIAWRPQCHGRHWRRQAHPNDTSLQKRACVTIQQVS